MADEAAESLGDYSPSWAGRRADLATKWVEPDALIVGAGTHLSDCLKTAGISYTVFERETAESFKTRSRNWGMSLYWGGEFLDKVLPPELKARLGECSCDPFYDKVDKSYLICNDKTGEVILAMQGVLPRRVSRRKLRELLSTGIDIQDGSIASGSNLIGCDGSRSRVRDLLVGAEKAKPVDTGIKILNLPYSYTAEQARALRAIHPIIKISYHPQLGNVHLLSILDVPDPDRPEQWKYQNLLSWKGAPSVEDLQDPSDRVKYLKETAAEYAEPWRTAGTSISDDTVLPIDRGLYWIPIEWDNHNGTVTLAGDAAHSMLPHRGQGLNHALQDAANLVQEMKAVYDRHKTLQEAISAYEAEMRPRAGQEVQITLKQAHMGHD